MKFDLGLFDDLIDVMDSNINVLDSLSDRRKLLALYLMKEYNLEAALIQVINASIVSISRNRYIVTYDNGVSELVSTVGNEVTIKNIGINNVETN